jgi:hypothetical protein
MIRVTYLRVGLVIVAITVNDSYEVTTAIGITEDDAFHRLLRKLE